jgi:hypothetical protein
MKTDFLAMTEELKKNNLMDGELYGYGRTASTGAAAAFGILGQLATTKHFLLTLAGGDLVMTPFTKEGIEIQGAVKIPKGDIKKISINIFGALNMKSNIKNITGMSIMKPRDGMKEIVASLKLK